MERLLDDYFSREQIKAEFGNVCDRTLHRWQKRGMPHTLIVGKSYFPKEGVRTWLASQVKGGAR
jgi:hypothetical protein